MITLIFLPKRFFFSPTFTTLSTLQGLEIDAKKPWAANETSAHGSFAHVFKKNPETPTTANRQSFTILRHARKRVEGLSESRWPTGLAWLEHASFYSQQPRRERLGSRCGHLPPAPQPKWPDTHCSWINSASAQQSSNSQCLDLHQDASKWWSGLGSQR